MNKKVTRKIAVSFVLLAIALGVMANLSGVFMARAVFSWLILQRRTLEQMAATPIWKSVLVLNAPCNTTEGSTLQLHTRKYSTWVTK
jgi:hypothetical protein